MNTFVPTKVFHDISATIQLATGDRYRPDNAAIIGPAGTGKTTALKEFVARTPGAIYIELTEQAGRSSRALCLFLCDELGIESGGATYQVERRLYRCLPAGAVIIFDEAQNMPANVVRAALNFNDMGQRSVVLCGNNDTLRQGRTSAAAFEQVISRIGPRVTIAATSDEDADAIAASFGIDSADCYAIVRAIGARYHARGIVRVLAEAGRLAGERKKITAAHVRAALDMFPQYRSALR